MARLSRRSNRAATRGRQANEGLPALLVLVALLALVMLTGGSARSDVFGTTVARLAAIGAGCWALWTMAPGEPRRIATPLALLVVLALVECLQSLPLPPGAWTALPGRGFFADIAPAAGIAQPWRPLSITPDLTLDAALALTVPAGVLLCFARVRERWWFWLLLAALLIGVVSALIGLVQVSTGASSLYFYRVTNADSAVGLFANRNHQATLLAAALPLALTFAAYPTEAMPQSRRAIAAVLICMLVVPLLLITGSRSGLALMMLGLGACWLLWLSGGGTWRTPRKRSARADSRLVDPRVAGLLLALLVLIGLTIVMSRAVSVQRLFTQDLAQERRFALLHPMLEMLWRYFPAGAGFGSFNDVFRIAEPFSNLNPLFMNHAHNDLLEFVFEGGVPAAVLLLAFVAWYARAAVAVWRRRRWGQEDRAAILGRLGSVQVGMLMIASLADYPLRTPSMAAMFALACGFLEAGRRPRAI